MNETSLPVGSLLDLAGKSAVVTGAGRGLGAAVARRFAEAGAAVAVHYRSSGDGAREVVSEIEAGGGRAVAVQADLTAATGVERVVEAALESFGRLDVVVNNAGAYPVSPLVEMSVEEWDTVIDANLKTVHLVTRAAARAMIDAGEGGAIVNVASIEGLAPAALHAHYTAAKAGVLMHTRVAALELGGHGIRVNAVAPGLIWKPGIEEEWPEGVSRWLEGAPLGRMGQPREVADACLFLASPASAWITGAALTVDGGMLARSLF